MGTRALIFMCLLGWAVASAAERTVVTPAGSAPPTGPYSPALMAGDFLYVSGQGAAKSDGSFPATTEQQVEQCLATIGRIVEASGLSMRHIVYAHLYLKDITRLDEANRAWARVFPADPPARAVLGVADLPTGTPIEITVVAYRDLARRRIVTLRGYKSSEPVSPAVLAGGRLYLSGMTGSGAGPTAQLESAFSRMSATLAAAGLDFRHLAFVNPYLTDAMPMEEMNRAYAAKFEFGNTPARATIRVASLPGGASVAFTGVAAASLAERRAVRPKNMPPSPTASPCVFAGDAYYCSAKSGFIPGPNSGIYASTVETQMRQTMRNLLDGLEEAGLDFSHVVASNVYLDDVREWAAMNKVYAEYFGKAPPSRTTVQQVAPVSSRQADSRGRWPMLEQMSVIAVK
ncbi:MAG: RidA family protein [Bryobacterales bacterium]|nr:RidA family protein [Bryobacterales bacterium]